MKVSKQQIANFEKNKVNVIKIISDNLNLSQKEIAEQLNKAGLSTKAGFNWSKQSVSFFQINEMELKYKNYTKDNLTINEIILNNQDKTLEQIANILNTMSFKTKKGLNWTKNSVYHYSINTLGLQQRNIIKANIESPLGITIDKLEYSNSSLNKEEHITRFNKNILNQLDKIEPKVTPELELEKEVLPNYEIKDLVFEKEGKFFTDSLMIASVFEKEHKNVLRSIENLNCSEKFNKLNFEPIFFRDSMNREKTKYLITKDGFVFLAMGFTGDKAAEFKEIYINKFNEMEQTIKQNFKPIKKELSAMELMAITLKGFQEQETKVLFEIKKESESIKHETNQVLQKQKIEFDKQFKALDERISNIPTANQPTEQLSFIQGNTKFINIDEKMQSKAHKEDDLFKATKDLIYKYSVKSKKDEWDIYPLLYKTFKHSTGIYLEKEKNIYNKQFLVAERISTIKYAQLKGHIPELHQIMTNLYNNLILACEKG